MLVPILLIPILLVGAGGTLIFFVAETYARITRGRAASKDELIGFLWPPSSLLLSLLIGLVFLALYAASGFAGLGIVAWIGHNTATASVLVLLLVGVAYPVGKDVTRLARSRVTTGVWVDFILADDGSGADLVVGNPLGYPVYDVRVTELQGTLLDLLPHDSDLRALLTTGIPRLPAEGKRYTVVALPDATTPCIVLDVSWTVYPQRPDVATARRTSPSTIALQEVAVQATRQARLANEGQGDTQLQLVAPASTMNGVTSAAKETGEGRLGA